MLGWLVESELFNQGEMPTFQECNFFGDAGRELFKVVQGHSAQAERVFPSSATINAAWMNQNPPVFFIDDKTNGGDSAQTFRPAFRTGGVVQLWTGFNSFHG